VSDQEYPKYARRPSKVDFTSRGLAERDLPAAERPTRRQLSYHYIHSGGKRYKVYDANELVDSLSELDRPGHIT
jgi:hypothetical protein